MHLPYFQIQMHLPYFYLQESVSNGEMETKQVYAQNQELPPVPIKPFIFFWCNLLPQNLHMHFWAKFSSIMECEYSHLQTGWWEQEGVTLETLYLSKSRFSPNTKIVPYELSGAYFDYV